jgi:hypothetical protein
VAMRAFLINYKQQTDFNSVTLRLSHKPANCHLASCGYRQLPTASSEAKQPKRRGRVVNNPASYSGGPEFDSRPRRTAVLIEVLRGSPQSLQANAGIVP